MPTGPPHLTNRTVASSPSYPPVPDMMSSWLAGWRDCPDPRTLDLYFQPTGTMLAEALEQRRELREVADDDGGLAGTWTGAASYSPMQQLHWTGRTEGPRDGKPCG